MQAMEEWTAIYTELLFRDLNILCNWVFFFDNCRSRQLKVSFFVIVVFFILPVPNSLGNLMNFHTMHIKICKH